METDNKKLQRKSNIFQILGGIAFGVFLLASVDLIKVLLKKEEINSVMIGGFIVGLLFVPILIQYLRIRKHLNKKDN